MADMCAGLPYPPAANPLIEFEAPSFPYVPNIKSPKSNALPRVAVVTHSIFVPVVDA